MGDSTAISWTDRTFNPWMGCQKASPGCAHCYAETLTRCRMGLRLWGPETERRITSAANWRKPHAWERQAILLGERLKVFSGSLMDYAEDHPTARATLPRLWQVIRETPHLDWQLLTKRSERIVASLPADWGDGYANVWLGVSIESQDFAWRVDYLRTVPAVVRFVSYEPALGPLSLDLDGIAWVIAGGESGPKHRPMDPQWARAMRDACARSDVAFFFKQASALRPGTAPELDGEICRAWPRPERQESEAA